MKTTGFALVVGGTAAILTAAAMGGCGGITALLPDDGGTDGHPSSGSGSGGNASGSTGGSSSGSGGTSSSTSSSGGFGSSSSTSSGSGGGSSTSSSGGFGSSSTSGSGGGSSSSGSGSSSGGSDTGTVYFEECTGASLCGSPTFDFFAGFGQASSGNPTGCTTTTSGSCSLSTCNGTSTNPIGVSAGILAISGGSIPAGTTVSPDSTNNYNYEDQGTLFAAGQTLTVSATGATVPAFGPVSVVAPGLPLFSAPAASNGAYTISTKADLPVAWTAGAAGGQIILEAGNGSSTTYFTCVWDASLGKAAIPQAMLVPMAGQSNGFLVYGQYVATNVTAGAYQISVSALPYTGGTVTFE